jgi:uncharacterized protein (DUF433 family)
MTQNQFLREFERLPTDEQLEVIQEALRIVRQKWQQLDQYPQTDAKQERLVEAANLLLQDYMQDEELTSLTALVGGCMSKLDRITVEPARMNGQPTIRNMRLTVRRVIELLALYLDPNELRREYPELENEDIRQALAYAAMYLDDRVLELAV